MPHIYLDVSVVVRGASGDGVEGAGLGEGAPCWGAVVVAGGAVEGECVRGDGEEEEEEEEEEGWCPSPVGVTVPLDHGGEAFEPFPSRQSS